MRDAPCCGSCGSGGHICGLVYPIRESCKICIVSGTCLYSLCAEISPARVMIDPDNSDIGCNPAQTEDTQTVKMRFRSAFCKIVDINNYNSFLILATAWFTNHQSCLRAVVGSNCAERWNAYIPTSHLGSPLPRVLCKHSILSFDYQISPARTWGESENRYRRS